MVSNVVEFKAPKPKVNTFIYNGQRVTVRYNPTANPDKRWEWVVEQQIVLTYYGEAGSEARATTAAKRKITQLIGDKNAG